MKRLLLSIALLIGLAAPAIALPSAAHAVDIFPKTCSGVASKTPVCDDVNAQKGEKSNPIIKIIKTAISIVSVIVGAAAIIGIIVSSLKLIASNGDSNSIASARSGIAYSLVGVVVVVVAQAFVAFVIDKV